MKKPVRISVKKTFTKKSENCTTKTVSNLLTTSIGLLLFSLLALGISPSMMAQETNSLEVVIMDQTSTIQKLEDSTATTLKKYTVKGVVLEENNTPLGGVNVTLKGTAQGVITNFDGKFEFPKVLEENDILVFSYIGYETQEYTITENESNTIEVTIIFKDSDIELLGAVEVEGVYTTKRNIFQKFIALFK